MLGKVITVGVILIAHGIRTTWQFCPGHCECINSELKVNCSVASGPDWQNSIVSSYVPLPADHHHHQQHHGSGSRHGGATTSSSATHLNEIPILLNPQIQILILHGNKIGDLTPYSLQYYTRLLELDLSSNRLGALGDGSFETLKSLQLLNVSANRIQSVGAGAFRGLATLVRLDLSANDIQTFQSTTTFKALTSLETLHLDKNRISHLHLSLFAHQSRLTTLTLSHNHIQSVSPLQQQHQHQPILPSLLLLRKQAGDGSNDDDGGSPAGLIELAVLDLSFNRLDRVGESVFDGLPHLQLLDLSHNMLQALEPNAFGNTLHLRHINLSHNSIDSLPPQTLSKCVELSAVDLSHNNLRAIPSHYFHNLFKLESVDVSHNPVELIEPTALADSINLVEFTGNHLLQLGHIPLQLLTNKPYLKLFSLQYANIQTLPLTAFPAESSPKVLLHQQQHFSPPNGLATEEEEQQEHREVLTNGLDFYGEPSAALLPPTALPLHTLDLTGNPWECNCSAYALYTYIINYAPPPPLPSQDDPAAAAGHHFSNIVCATPAQVASLPLIQLPADTFASCVQQSDSFMETVLILAASLVALLILILLVKVLITTGACARLGNRKQSSSSPIVQVPPTFHRASAAGHHQRTPPGSYNSTTTRTTSTNGVDYIHHPHLPYAMPPSSAAPGHHQFLLNSSGHPSQFGNLLENYPPRPPPFFHGTLGGGGPNKFPPNYNHQNHHQQLPQPTGQAQEDHQHIIFPTTLLRGPRLHFNNQHYYHTVKHPAFHNNRYEKQVPSVLV